jgi:ATP-dependent Zn protease
VIGAAAAKEALTFVRDWLRDPQKYAAAGVDPPRGVLLTGPPGTGKTMLARAHVKELFARARRYAPSVVFIDEIDAIGATRSSVAPGLTGHGEGMALNQLLAEMDGFSRSSARPIIVLAATNYPERLDPALKRRFGREIEVELPTRAERELYLRRRLASRARHGVSEEALDRLAAQTQGFSIAHLERVLAQAAVMAIANDGVIDDAVLGEAFEKVTMGDPKAGADVLRTARHEAGHALVMCELGDPPIYTTIVGRGAFGGYAAFDDKGQRRALTKPELEGLVCVLLGGREAERLYYGEGTGDSTGPSNDLERATGLAEAMVYDFGMSEEMGFVRLDRARAPIEPCLAAVRHIIEGQGTRARQILTERRNSLDAIVEALMSRSRLTRPELMEIVARTREVTRPDR